jgi:hypothetical protein
MKKILLLTPLFFFCVFGYAQNCPAMIYSYDQNGQRIQRQLSVIYCGSGDALKTKPTRSDTSIAVVHAKVYPNPAQDKLTIEMPASEDPTVQTNAMLFDLQGKNVFSGTYPSPIFTIDVSGLPVGEYLLSLAVGKKRTSYHVFKQ